jgi:hypothetical protein
MFVLADVSVACAWHNESSNYRGYVSAVRVLDGVGRQAIFTAVVSSVGELVRLEPFVSRCRVPKHQAWRVGGGIWPAGAKGLCEREHIHAETDRFMEYERHQHDTALRLYSTSDQIEDLGAAQQIDTAEWLALHPYVILPSRSPGKREWDVDTAEYACRLGPCPVRHVSIADA